MTLSITDALQNNVLHYAECCYSECRILIIVMLIAIMLIVDMMNVIMLSVAARWDRCMNL
jgi:hypothetical protein